MALASSASATSLTAVGASASLLASENLCGASLLQLTASGSAIIAELLRLSSAVPSIFLPDDAAATTAGGKEAATPNKIDAEFATVCFDFAYLREPEEFENRVNTTAGLLDLDTDFLEAHGAFARRAYALFESMVKYWKDVRGFLERLASGYYIRHSLDNLLDDVDGKQLISEAFFLYGSMLLLMEARLPGIARERLVVACYREQQSRLELVDEVCKLVRRTEGSKKRNKGLAPLEILLSRFADDITTQTAKKVIATLASDDVYLTSSAFPDPSMRTTRLAAQASLVYVVLHFDPETLKNDESAMRQVVDRHFADCWIVPVYMGHTVNLAKEWASSKPYKAASSALANVLTSDKVKHLAEVNKKRMMKSLKELDGYLREGQLTEQLLLDHMRDLLDAVRRSNAVLRWRLLHGKASYTGEASSKTASYFAPSSETITLLLKTSQLEYKLKEMLQNLLATKKEKWAFCKSQVVERMTELSEYFTGEKRLARVNKDDNLTRWFASLAKETESLDDDDSSEQQESSSTKNHATMLGRKIQTLINALEEVEQFEQVDTNLQIKAFLGDTREFLLQMVRITNVQHSVVDVLDTVSDLSYAWEILRDYVGILHDRVRRDPATAVLLRATFLKLASILDVPLIRISQCNSPDAASVAQYYSSELVTFARNVLDVIPVSLFKVLDEIIDIQTFKLAPLPVKFETIYLKNYAQLNERYQLAKLTNQVSVFTEGVLAMEKTLLGVIRVEPRRILHDGLRKELVRQLAVATRDSLVFFNHNNSNNTPDYASTEQQQQSDDNAVKRPMSFTAVLDRLAAKVDGYRRSVEYVQDYIDIAGLKMWQEELGRVVNYAVEQESNRYLRRKIYDADSKFQSDVAPIPAGIVRGTPQIVLREQQLLKEKAESNNNNNKKGNVMPSSSAMLNDSTSLTFMGRTLFALAKLTAPEESTYSPEACAWFSSTEEVLPSTLWGFKNANNNNTASKKNYSRNNAMTPTNLASLPESSVPREVCGVETFDAVERALGVVGLAGLDKLLAFRVVHELSRLMDEYQTQARPLMAFIEKLRDDALEPDWLPPAGGDVKFYAATAKKLDALATLTFHRVRKIGHAQLLRRSVAHALALKSRLDANHLHQALEALDVAVVNDVVDHYRRARKQQTEEDSSQDDVEANPYPVDSTPAVNDDSALSPQETNDRLLPKLARLLDASGFADPLDQVYVAAEPLNGLPAVLLVVILSAASKLDHDPRLGTLVKRKRGAPLDGYVLVVGVLTLLKQFHPSFTRQLLAYLGQFVSATLQSLSEFLDKGGPGIGASSSSAANNSKQASRGNNAATPGSTTDPLPNDLLNVAWFVTHLAREAKIPNVTDYIPADILHLRPAGGPPAASLA